MAHIEQRRMYGLSQACSAALDPCKAHLLHQACSHVNHPHAQALQAVLCLSQGLLGWINSLCTAHVQAVEAHMARLQAEKRAEAAAWSARTASEAAAADRAIEELRPQLRPQLVRLAVRTTPSPAT